MSTPSDRLDAIRARAEAATEGEWHAGLGGALDDDYGVFADSAGAVVIAAEFKPDAEFIAASRSDVPDLVAFARAVLDLAEWHETKADKARLYPGPGDENALVMTKSAAVHDDAARRLRALADEHLTTRGDDDE